MKIAKIETQEIDLSNLTTFQMAGSAKKLLKPRNAGEFIEIIKTFKEDNLDFRVIGGGSNTIIRDGAEISLIATNHLSQLEFDGNQVRAEVGVKLSTIVWEAAQRGLSGIEFASGIPGTIGGAIFMNSGAFGGEISQYVKSVTVVDENGSVRELNVAELGFSYRTSIFHNTKLWVMSCVLRLNCSTPEEVSRKNQLFLKIKKRSQPLTMPSVGCIFKNPKGDYAARLIDAAGLKGFQIGGVRISTKHAGFFVNAGGATFKDFKSVYTEVFERVKEKFGVELEPEITIVW